MEPVAPENLFSIPLIQYVILLQPFQGGQHTFYQDCVSLVGFYKKSNPAKNLAGPYQSCRTYFIIDTGGCQNELKPQQGPVKDPLHPGKAISQGPAGGSSSDW
ncbi:MAG TPA: hypothetical protein DCY42_01790 [Chloroflexi bacterium]|nr:hypothetical protein [Chloroflexota bacterium]